MTNKILIANIGSASKKYALYDGVHCLVSAHFEKGDDNKFVAEFKFVQKIEREKTSEAEYKDALAYTLHYLIEEKILGDNDVIPLVAIRVVAPGEYFTEHRVIDEEYLKKLEEARELAPLHISSVLSELKEIKELLPRTNIVGISDSAYHKTMPEVARRYALNDVITSEFGIYRYGYHGLSVASVVEKLKLKPGGIPKRVIVCHLGSGASVTALEHGESVDTSMGFTPLEGVPMGSRVGDIDAGAVLYLQKELKLSAGKLFHYLNTEAGLYGLSGGVSDIRELLSRKKNGEAKAASALDMFTYKIKQHIGSYMAILGGLDALIFTGTVGERAPRIRSQICEGLSELGIVLDHHKNELYTGDKDGHIQSAASRAGVIVFQSDEMKIMAREADKML